LETPRKPVDSDIVKVTVPGKIFRSDDLKMAPNLESWMDDM
jgi:hypothetical protein